MNKTIKVAAVAAGMIWGAGISSASAAWQYDEEAGTISDGNWTFAVSSWKDTTFQTTAGATGYLAGSGELDLAAAEEDLGRKWGYQKNSSTAIRTSLP